MQAQKPRTELAWALNYPFSSSKEPSTTAVKLIRGENYTAIVWGAVLWKGEFRLQCC